MDNSQENEVFGAGIPGFGAPEAPAVEEKTTENPARSAKPAPPGRYPLEPTPELMREWLDQVSERVIEHIRTLPEQPATNTEGSAELAQSLIEETPPEKGQELPGLLDLLFNKVVPTSFTTAGPGYLAYIPGGGLFHSALADLIADTTNRFVTVWQAAPGKATIESNVVKWFAGMMGLPQKLSGGFLTSGGSLATFSAIVTARRDRLPNNFLTGTIYTSDQVHHCVTRAAILAGFPEANVRKIPVDSSFRIQHLMLEKKIKEDKEEGYTPFLVVGTGGTTNTGAVDDLEKLAEICKREKMWFHVDAAYGGFFMLTERGRTRLKGIEKSDSIVLDPHKGMFLPYGCGCLLVRDRRTLLKAHGVQADYLPEMSSDPDFVDFSQISPELSRDWRGLRVWLPLKMAGLQVFRELIDEKLDLTDKATEDLRKIPGIEILAEPQLTIVGFRLKKEGMDEETLNVLNRDLLERINARKRIFISSAIVNGRYILRLCVLNFRTHGDRMEAGLEDIRQSVRELA